MKKNYPANEGWLTVKVKIQPGTKLSQDLVVRFATAGDPKDYEVAVFKHFKTVINCIFRKRVDLQTITIKTLVLPGQELEVKWTDPLTRKTTWKKGILYNINISRDLVNHQDYEVEYRVNIDNVGLRMVYLQDLRKKEEANNET